MGTFLTLAGCSQTKISGSEGSCEQSNILGAEARDAMEYRVSVNGAFAMTFALKEGNAIQALVLKTSVFDTPARVTIRVFVARVNDGLGPIPGDYEFSAELAPNEDMNPTMRTIAFPVPFVASALDDASQYAISLTVDAGTISLFQGYVRGTNHIQRRFASSYQGGSWTTNSEVGLTLGLKIAGDCAAN